MSRPTKYTLELLENARAYLEDTLPDGQVVHTIEGLALAIDVRRETCHVWANDPEKVEFSNILDKIMSSQGLALQNKGLTGEYNSNIAKLMLTKHGLSDKVDNTHGGPDGGPIQFQNTTDEQLEAIVAGAKPS